mgnify:CR=1 FL=1
MELGFNEKDLAVFSLTLPADKKIEERFSSWLPGELERATNKRKQEYVAGRYCASKAAESLGVKLTKLPSSVTREPLWPEGMVGSISHSKALVVSGVSISRNICSVGIDAEEILRKNIGVEDYIATDSELKLLKGDYQRGLTVLFSGKEALYKALFPIVRCFIDFKEVLLTSIDFEKQSFELELRTSTPSLQKSLGTYQGIFQQYDETIISLVKISKT